MGDLQSCAGGSGQLERLRDAALLDHRWAPAGVHAWAMQATPAKLELARGEQLRILGVDGGHEAGPGDHAQHVEVVRRVRGDEAGELALASDPLRRTGRL